MKKHFVWSRDIERVIQKELSDKRKRLASNTDGVTELFGKAAEASEHWYSLRSAVHELSKNLKNPNMSSICRRLGRNARLWEGVGLIFSALELQKVLAAPAGSIIIMTFDIGGYGFEVIKPTDPDYKQAFTRLPGAT